MLRRMPFLRHLALSFAGVAALLGPAAVPAQPAATPAPTGAVAADRPVAASPALWRVGDADTTIYLFGTIHLLPKGIEWYRGPLVPALEASSELVTEIPELDQNENMAAMMRHAVLPEGQSLRAGMTEKELATFTAALAGLGLPADAFDRYRPWYAAVVLATMPLKQAGYDLQNGVEAQLSKRNQTLGHARIGLETIDYQLGLFAALSPDVQKKYLFDVIAALPEAEHEIGKMVQAWSTGDALALADMLNDEQTDPAMIEALLHRRNKAWADWIARRLARPGTVFVAVGAGHLGGKGSVQDELAARGLAVTRVQ